MPTAKILAMVFLQVFVAVSIEAAKPTAALDVVGYPPLMGESGASFFLEISPRLDFDNLQIEWSVGGKRLANRSAERFQRVVRGESLRTFRILPRGQAEDQVVALIVATRNGMTTSSHYVWPGSRQDELLSASGGVEQEAAGRRMFVAGADVKVANVMRQKGGPKTKVFGVVTFEDKILGDNGFTGAFRDLPGRYLIVRMIDHDNGEVLAETRTNGNGVFRLRKKLAASHRVRVWVLAANDKNVFKIEVRNNDKRNAVWSLRSEVFEVNPGDRVDLTFHAYHNRGGAVFNIFDVVADSRAVMVDFAGRRQPPIVLYWQPGSFDGTFSNPFDNSIHLLGLNLDDDGYDDHVIIHELGHFYMANNSRDDSPGGPHRIDDLQQDLRLSWSEGYASYFSAELRGNPILVDNFGTNEIFSFSIETIPDDRRGAANEHAIAAILWDASDPVNEPHDGVFERFQPIDRVVREFMRFTIRTTIFSFCDGWAQTSQPNLGGFLEVASFYGVDCSSSN